MVFKESLPYPPSINDYYGRRPKGGVYIKAHGREYRALVCSLIEKRGQITAFSDRLSVSVDIYPPDNRRRDADNVLKALLDALTHAGIYLDDCLIFELTVVKHDKDEAFASGKVDVEIVSLEFKKARKASADVAEALEGCAEEGKDAQQRKRI